MLNSEKINDLQDKRVTVDVNEEVANCESLDELKELLNKNSNYYMEWKNYINLLMERSHMNYMQMAKNCHCSRNTVKKWCKEGSIPQNRDTFIKIGFAFRLNMEEFNRLLQRYGKYHKLYAKNMDDAVCIFVINHYPEDGDAYECYLQLREHLLKRLRDLDERVDIPKDTLEIEEDLLSKSSKEEFEEFILANQKSYSAAFDKLIEFLELFIKEKEDNIHRYIKSNNLSVAYEKMLSLLRKKGECPDRLKLIMLGVSLNMSLEQINYMLSLAHMESMVAKDKLECIIMYVVDNAYLHNPSFTIESAIILQHYERNPMLQSKCKEILKKYWGQTDKDIINNSEQNPVDNFSFWDNSIGDYLQFVMEELELDDEIILKYL